MGYKDMMRMIGNFKHVPAVIANSAPIQEYNRYSNGGTLDETDPFWPYQQTNYFNPSLSMGFSPFQFNNLDSGISGSLNYTHPLASYSTPGGQSRFDFGQSFTASGLMGQEEDAYTSTWQGEPYTVDADFWNNRANLGFNAAYQSLIGNRGLVAGGELEGGIGMGTNTIDTPYGFQSTAVGSPYASGQVGLGYYPENSPYNARAILGYGTELAPAHRPGGYFGLYGGMGPLQLGITKDRQGWGGGFDLSFPLGSKNPEVIPDVYQTGGIMPVEGGMGSVSSSAFLEAAEIKNKAGGAYKGLTPYNMDVTFEHDLITSNIGSFKKGGRMRYENGGIEDVTALADTGATEAVGGIAGLAGAAVEEQETLSLDESSNLIGDLNPHVSDENYTSFYNQLQISENAANKGYNKEQDLWFPFDVSDKERNIGWGINMSTFSKEEQDRISKGITTAEVEEMYKNRIASHLDKSQKYINTWQGDWTRDDKSGNTGYKGAEGNWDKLPDNVKLALTDFSYNLGGLEKFPKFITSIMNNDLEGAKAEYKRYWKNKGVKTELTKRNEEIYNMIFKDAKGDGKIYRKGGLFTTYTKGGIFENGGTIDPDEEEDKVNYSKSIGSKDKGTFPRMSNENIINGNVNKNVYLSLAMARHYGYEGEIDMTSGQRSPEAQWSAMLNNINIHGKHKLGDYSKSFQKVVNDAAAANGGYNTKETKKVIVDWLNQQLGRYHNGEIDSNELGGLTSRHILGEAVDFTGDFKTWLAEGDAGTNKEAAEFIKDFNVHVYNETDHFHVSFKDIDTDKLSETSEIFKENLNHYDVYNTQFTDLSTSSEKFPDISVINMNPLSYQGKRRDYLYGPVIETLPIITPDLTIPTETPTTLPKATLSPGYEAYRQYRDEATRKQEKTIGYQLHENLGMMDKYNPQNPILSFDEWLNENPEFQEDIDEQDPTRGDESVRPGDHGFPFPGSVENEIVEETDYIETIMKKTGKPREEVISIIESTRQPTVEQRMREWHNEQQNNPEVNPWENPVPRTPTPEPWEPLPLPRTPTPGPWEPLPGDELSPQQVNPYEQWDIELEKQRIQQNLQTTYEIGNHVNDIKNMINNWKSNK
jgi:hypothetical protein